MRAGSMRDRIELQSADNANDAEWGPELLWVTERTVWASVRPLLGTEKQSDEGVQAIVTHQIRIRGGQYIDSKWRAIYRGRKLDFVSVIDVDRLGCEWLIDARENIENVVPVQVAT